MTLILREIACNLQPLVLFMVLRGSPTEGSADDGFLVRNVMSWSEVLLSLRCPSARPVSKLKVKAGPGFVLLESSLCWSDREEVAVGGTSCLGCTSVENPL